MIPILTMKGIPISPKNAGFRIIFPCLRYFSFCCLSLFSSGLQAQDDKFSQAQLKKLSMEELMNIEVTMVSRSPEKLAEVASAVQLITGEDIRNSGATNIAEALRLVTNLQVAQLN